MESSYPRKLFIECPACGISNMIDGFTPEKPVICNQCRERMIEPTLNETHSEILCEDCGLTLLFLKETEFVEGESTCRCGSTHLSLFEESTIAEDAEEAGAFDLEDESFEDKEDEDDGLSWIRSDSDLDHDEDYNDMFDRDPG